jgi:hypothetical protein
MNAQSPGVPGYSAESVPQPKGWGTQPAHPSRRRLAVHIGIRKRFPLSLKRLLARTLVGINNLRELALRAPGRYIPHQLGADDAAARPWKASDQLLRDRKRIPDMRSHARKAIAAMTLLAGSGFVMSGPGTSCSSYIVKSGFVATDMCFIFDCQNGILGGTIDPCSGIGSGNQTGEGQTRPPLFTDCPTNQGP